MKNITLVLGTARSGRQSEKVYTFLATLLKARQDVSLELVDVRDHVTKVMTQPSWGEGGADQVPTKWKKIVEKTDIFIFILPEYNHGYPGEWKLLVDTLGIEYKGKHAFVVGVSAGMFSGVRVADHVKTVLVELNLVPHKTGLYIGGVKTAFDEGGKPIDTNVDERARKFIDEVVATV